MTSEAESLRLWEVLAEKATVDQRQVVVRLVDDACALLDRVVETFPTYTLHNRIHARNVAELMANLLGPSLGTLTSLEAAMLILSAYWHDVGMVFSESARASLESEAYWHEFLTENPEAFISVEESGELSMEIAEWYCRWRHADRIYVHLDNQKADRLRWGRISFREALGELCRSHNQSIADIKTNDALQNNYLEEADLKLCAIVLRLADILDFDNSRSPDSVYRMLGLGNRATKREKASDVEWRKHLDSDGFRFPEERERSYELGFIAGPGHPAVEHDIRGFLDVIENQFEECLGLLPFCSPKWRELALPGQINRDNIKSNGFRYGRYQFLLDQAQVLNLLMGENLYEDRYVVVRELIQNAIDTSRYREHCERLSGNSGFKCRPIQVTDWRDQEGRLWIRVDDFGMGMDETIIREHLLKVGSSYYQTAAFRAEVLRAQKRGASDFVPISRFGIGLLSCFIIGDRVEISTRNLSSLHKAAAEPIRLSLEGLHGFYVMQSGHMRPDGMPSPEGEQSGYRWEIGTSVAVRIDPHKDWGFDLESVLKKHILSSPIAIELNGETWGHDYEMLIRHPWCDRQTVDLGQEEIAKLNDWTGHSFSDPPQLEIIPLDLTRHSPDPEFEGQMVMIVLRPSAEWLEFLNAVQPFFRLHFLDRWNWGFKWSGGLFTFKLSLWSQPYRDRDSWVRDVARVAKSRTDPFAPALLKLVERLGAARPFDAESGRFSLHLMTEQKTYEFHPEEGFHGEVACELSAATAVEALPPGIVAAIRDLDETGGRRISHNGVVIPPYSEVTGDGPSERYPLNLDLQLFGPLGSGALSWGTVALSDSMRPDVDVSRGSLRRVPIKAYSNAVQGLYWSLRAEGIDDYNQSVLADLTQIVSKELPTLGQLIDERELDPIEDWVDIPLFRLDEETYLSLREVQAQLKNGTEAMLWELPGGWRRDSSGTSVSYPYRNSYNRIWVATLAQLHFNLEVRLDAEGRIEGFVVVPGPTRELHPGQRFYSSFTFLPYSTGLLAVEGCGVNIDHPFSQWLLEITPALFEKYPAVFGQLRALMEEVNFRRLSKSTNFDQTLNPEVFFSSLSKILQDMRRLEPKYRPPASLALDQGMIRKAVGRLEEID